MQTHQKLAQIRCVQHDLFRKVGYLCYGRNGSRAIPFPLVIESFGKPMGIVGDCEAPIPHAGCRCGEAMLSLMGREGSERVWGPEVHVPGDLWAHHVTEREGETHRGGGSCFSLSTCFCGPVC